MKTMKQLQEEILQNKREHGFNTTNVMQEICYLQSEVSEVFDAYIKDKSKEQIDSELADTAIFLLGLSEILDCDLYQAIIKKMEINKNRKYSFTAAGNPCSKIEPK
jgi:NTP pyrophosphatase (non-canonical NTP hydrolase)